MKPKSFITLSLYILLQVQMGDTTFSGQESILCRRCSAENLHYQGRNVRDNKQRNKSWGVLNEK